MKHDLQTTPCGACAAPVFTGAAAVVCAKCGAFAHRTCWTAAKDRCSGANCGSRKCTPVAVVRLQPPGPTVEELTASVHARFEEVFHKVMADVRMSMSHREDVEKLRDEVRAVRVAMQTEAESAKEREASLRKEMHGHIQEAVRAVQALEQAVRSIPKPSVGQELSEASKDIAGRTDRAVSELRKQIVESLQETARDLRIEARRNLAAVEACRWDTAARRSPLPWDARSDDVALPSTPRDED